MKSLKSLTLAIVALAISACTNGQFWRSVEGHGNVVTKERKVSSFNGIKVSSGVDVYLQQGNNEQVTVEADENLHEFIITEVKGGVLNVYTENNIRHAEKMRVHVTAKELNTIKTTSAGDIHGESTITGDKLEISASSAGDIKLDIKTKYTDVDISSSGDISLSGETDVLKADLSSAGDLNAFQLTAKEADVSVSSAGDADINVTDKLTARASSAGDINYKGDPKYVDVRSSSAGSVHRK